MDFASLTVVDYLVILAFLPAAGFPLVYLTAPWWKTPAGRSTMGLALVIASTLGLSVWRSLTGELAPVWLRLPIYALIVLALWAQFIVLLLAPKLNRRRKLRALLPVPPEV